MFMKGETTVKMKKIVTGLLTLSLTLCAGMSSVAAESTIYDSRNGAFNSNISGYEKADKYTGQVTVNVDPAATVYYVTVDWESLDFTYNLGTWNPENHSYAGGGWGEKTAANITVKNHSNTDITVDANFKNNEKTITNEEMNVTANITLLNQELESAENSYGEFENADSTTIRVALDDDKEPTKKTKQLLETVTVVFGKKS